MAIIGIVIAAIYLILALVGVGFLANASANAVDDDLVRGVTTAGAIGVGIVAALYVVALLFYVFMLFAALKYNVCMLVTVIVFDCLYFIWSIYLQIATAATSADMAVGIVLTCLFTGLWIYPTAGLISEIKSGVMSAETYPREAYSCCCEPQV